MNLDLQRFWKVSLGCRFWTADSLALKEKCRKIERLRFSLCSSIDSFRLPLADLKVFKIDRLSRRFKLGVSPVKTV